jgi:DNA-binding beta-propeller fold protein YncE
VITDSASKYLYVTNTQSPGLYQSGSVITAFDITASTGDLTTLAPGYFGTGATPVCIFEDPSHQYLYTADAGSSTVTGALIDPNTGILTDLRKGSSFTTVGTPTWCLYSSNTD